MPLLETATSYLLAKNEAIKKFPQDFITASMKWVRSRFLTDDPVPEKIVNSPPAQPPSIHRTENK